MSKKSNQNQQNSNEESNPDIEKLSDSLDFWNLESDSKDLETSEEDLEEINAILAQKNTDPPLKPLSENIVEHEVPCEKEIISSLDKHIGDEKIEDLPDIADKDVEELLASAKADALAEDDADAIEATPEPTPKPPVAKPPKPAKTASEKIAIISCYAAILCVFGYLIHYASNQHNFDTSKVYDANTPATGEYASIENIETWWSKPAGNNTKFSIILVPSATITLAEDSTSGALRAVFYSSEEGIDKGTLKPKGDPFTMEFRDGKFLESGTNQITIYGTDGFSENAHFMFYRGQDEERWTIEIKEAPTTNAKIDSFSFLAKAPIDPTRK